MGAPFHFSGIGLTASSWTFFYSERKKLNISNLLFQPLDKSNRFFYKGWFLISIQTKALYFSRKIGSFRFLLESDCFLFLPRSNCITFSPQTKLFFILTQTAAIFYLSLDNSYFLFFYRYSCFMTFPMQLLFFYFTPSNNFIFVCIDNDCLIDLPHCD